MKFTEKYRLQEKMLDRYRCLLDSGELDLKKDENQTRKRLILIEMRKISAWLKEWHGFYTLAHRQEQNDELTVGDVALFWREIELQKIN